MSDTLAPYDPATDPGTEVVDLPDELAMTGAESDSWLDQLPHVPTPDLSRLIGFPDYVWLSWLADELRAAGCSVVEHPGWKTRGRPRSVGPFVPLGMLWHHDGSGIGPSPSMARFIAQEGRPDEGIPAPLSQCWVCMGCDGAHPVGTWHVLAAGRCNHGGIGEGWGRIGRDLANSVTLGVETDNTTGEPTPVAMLTSLVVGSAAILKRLGADPADSLAAHREYALGRKVDPDDIDMDKARAAVAQLIENPTPKPPRPGLVKFPGVEHFTTGHQCKHGYVKQLENWLVTVYPKAKHEPGDTFTRWTRDTVRKFQRADARLAGDPDGIPGPLTWKLLQQAARKAARS